MTTRTHLSIGEVLDLLSDDFPDLTITKIRFLESQGLIEPERTASGYRKFYDFDIERLRWILRQQRENFLPLKVIKDRLDESEGRNPTPRTAAPAQAELDLARDPGAADPPPVWMADHARSTQERGGNDDGAAATVAVDDAPGEPARSPSKVESVAPPADDGPSPGVEAPTTKRPARKKSGGGPAKKKSEKPMTPGKSKESPAPPPSASTVTGRDVSDMSMTRSELLGAAGLDEAQLTQLESFGIVVATGGSEDPLYDADALVCARHAATMLSAGLEPRHLRIFKVAADREAGLYEQLILPVLRRRTPDARTEALATVNKLTASGAAIHAALLRGALGGQFRTHP